MKRFFYWFAWLQLGMPLVVAFTAFTAVGMTLPNDADINEGGLFYATAGCIFFAPFLLVNAIPISVMLMRPIRRRRKALILGIDCLIALLHVAVLMHNAPLRELALFSAGWLLAGFLVSWLALKLEPRTQRVAS